MKHVNEVLLKIRQIFKRKDDPVAHCEVYLDKKNGSCSHVDGYLCDYPHCSILHDYKYRKANNEDVIATSSSVLESN